MQDFLLNMELDAGQSDYNTHPNVTLKDQLYSRGGHKICSSKIRNDDEDPIIDLTREIIPFVRKTDLELDDDDVNNEDVVSVHRTKIHYILDIQEQSTNITYDFADSLPFQLLGCNESHFTRYILKNAARNNKQVSIKDMIELDANHNQYSDIREEVIEMLKDTPVGTNRNYIEAPTDKRKHSRKCDPTRPSRRKSVDKELCTKNCYICGTIIERDIDKFIVICKQSKDSVTINCTKNNGVNVNETDLIRIVCFICLEGNFRAKDVSPFNHQTLILKPLEYLVVNGNKQYVFQKTTNINFKDANIDRNPTSKSLVEDDTVEIGDMIHSERNNDENRTEENNDGGKNTNGPNPLECRFCHREFTSMTEVGSHAIDHRHITKHDHVIPCPLCEYGYPNLIWLKSHLKREHDHNANSDSVPGEGADQNYSDQNVQSTIGESPGERAISDTPVDRYTVVQVEVKREVSDDDDDEAIWIVQSDGDHCLDARLDEDNKRNSQPKRPKPVDPQLMICHDCNEHFTSKVRLRFHLQFHHPDPNPLLTVGGRFVCPDCPQSTFDTDSQLFDHLHFQHPRLKFWKCVYKGCGKTFNLKATLTKHRRSHTNSRRYICGTCGKRFLDKQTLDEHGVTHMEIKPFKCHICLKQLTRRSRLRMHLRAHEEPVLRPVMVCGICAQAFRDCREAEAHILLSPTCVQKYNEDMRRHQVQSHLSPSTGIVTYTVPDEGSPPLSKPIKLQSASAEVKPMLSQLSDTAQHIVRVVEIDKALRCEYCELVYYTEEGLNEHRLVHKGVTNPYICHICKVSFSTYSRCTTHKTTHGFFRHPLMSDADAVASQVLGYGDFPVVKHFLCEVCSRSYLHWTYLQVHRRNKHKRKIQHICYKCNMTFPHGWALANHKKKLLCTADKESSIDFDRIYMFNKDIRIEAIDDDDQQIDQQSNSQYSYSVKYNLQDKKNKIAKHDTQVKDEKGEPSNDKCAEYEDFGKKYQFVYDHNEQSVLSVNYVSNDKNKLSGSDGRINEVSGEYDRQNQYSILHDNGTIDRNDSRHKMKGYSVSTQCTKKDGKQKDTYYRIKCRDCEAVLTSKTELYEHRNKLHSIWFQFDNTISNEENMKESENKMHAKQTTSVPCQNSTAAVSTTDEISLDVDVRIKNTQKLFSCNSCGVAFASEMSLRVHEKSHSRSRRSKRVHCEAVATASREDAVGKEHAQGQRQLSQEPQLWKIIQMRGKTPSSQDVIKALQNNGIPFQGIIDISSISLDRGARNVIPDSLQALNELVMTPKLMVVGLSHVLPRTRSS